MPTIAVLPKGDVREAAALFARAFDRDQVARLVSPDPEQRRRFQERGGRAQIDRAMPYRHVFGAYEDSVLRGIAVWLPPGVTVRGSVRPPLTALPRMGRAVRQPGAVRLVRQRQKGLKQAQSTPGWHLAFLATDPDFQRRGIGRRLMEHVLSRADADDTPVWLETSDPVNVPLYEKFGFVTIAEARGGPDLPTFWVMVREAQRPSG
ncbi:MAG TPA: GNAT family N-acetyltransferase [Nocardioidaceae bacterium]|nr:GNAT family N-acetyltransferase [Nocardioidaceae bacterium]